MQRLLLATILVMIGSFIISPVIATTFPSEEDEVRLRQQGKWQQVLDITSKYSIDNDLASRKSISYLPQYAKPLAQATKDTVRCLVICVDFEDNPALDTMQNAKFFETGLFSKDKHSVGSMRDYFLENSYGQLEVIGNVYGWYRMPNPFVYYVGENYGFSTGEGNQSAWELIKDALTMAEDDIDYSSFDRLTPIQNFYNNAAGTLGFNKVPDGIIDALIMVYPKGQGVDFGNPKFFIWPHRSWVPPAFLESKIDGAEGANYTIQYSSFVYDDEPPLSDLRIFFHEFGHILGLPDLYSRIPSTPGLQRWSLMANGIGHLDAWCKWKLGWITPFTPIGDTLQLPIPNHAEKPFAVLLTNLLLDEPEGNTEEFFMVENRANKGFDTYVPNYGLVVYHIDEDFTGQGGSRPLIAYLREESFPGSDNTKVLNASSVPPLLPYSGEYNGLKIENISKTSATMTADIYTTPDTLAVKFLTHTITTLFGDAPEEYIKNMLLVLTVNIRSLGKPLSNLIGILEPQDPILSPLAASDTILNTLKINQDGTLSFTLKLTDTPTNNILVYVNVRLSNADGFKDVIEIPIMLTGNRAGKRLAFEEGPDGFTHESNSWGKPDLWHLTTQRNKTIGGRYAWKCGPTEAGEKYPPNMDNLLISPPMAVEPNDILQFDSWIDATTYKEIGDPSVLDRWALDGGFLEISTNFGPWELLSIPGSYYSFSNDRSRFPEYYPTIEEFACISGHERTWKTYKINLGNRRGVVQIRWRFSAMFFYEDTPRYEGWFVDNIYIGPNKANDIIDLPETKFTNWFSSPSRLPISFNTDEFPIFVYDLTGRKVASISSSVWNGRTNEGRLLSQGVYIVKAKNKQPAKLVLIK